MKMSREERNARARQRYKEKHYEWIDAPRSPNKRGLVTPLLPHVVEDSESPNALVERRYFPPQRKKRGPNKPKTNAAFAQPSIFDDDDSGAKSAKAGK